MTKSDLIRRADAVRLLVERYKFTTSEATEILSQLPSAEAVQGEWGHMIADGKDGSHWYEYECSHCGEVVLRPYNYCPNCGADMRGEEE